MTTTQLIAYATENYATSMKAHLPLAARNEACWGHSRNVEELALRASQGDAEAHAYISNDVVSHEAAGTPLLGRCVCYAHELRPDDLILNSFGQPHRRVERVERARARGYVVVTGPALGRVEFGAESRTSLLAKAVLMVVRPRK